MKLQEKKYKKIKTYMKCVSEGLTVKRCLLILDLKIKVKGIYRSKESIL